MLRVATAKVVAVLMFVFGVAVLAPAAASARLVTVGLGGWQVQSSAGATRPGSQVSQVGFPTGSWLDVHPDDAGAVGTEVNALVQNGRCPSVFFSTNMKTCFGYMNTVGPDTIPEFSVPWWFRTTFFSQRRASEHAQLVVSGVVGEADVWVNGTRVATKDSVQGAYTRYTFDVTGLLHRGPNALALKVYPNDPTTMFTLDNVDWTQIPPDNNTGIQFPIQLHTSGPLAIGNAHVVEHNAPDLSSSSLALKADVTNVTGAPQTGIVAGHVHFSRRRQRRIREPDAARQPRAGRDPDGVDPAADRPPERLVAVPDGRPAALPPDDDSRARLRRPRQPVRDVCDPHDHHSPDWGLRDRTRRLPAVPRQRQGVRVPRRRLV